MCNRPYINQEALNKLQKSLESKQLYLASGGGYGSNDGCAISRTGGGMKVTE